jgi:hypothetical protein
VETLYLLPIDTQQQSRGTTPSIFIIQRFAFIRHVVADYLNNGPAAIPIRSGYPSISPSNEFALCARSVF